MMRITKFFYGLFAVLFGLLGLALAAGTVKLCFENLNAVPVLLTPADNARTQVVRMFDAVCSGDYEAAAAYMQAEPQLGVDRAASGQVGVLIWDAFEESLSYELVGQCYATHSGVAQDVRFTCLDISSVTQTLRQRSQALLAQRVENAQDVSEIYNENNEYREELVMQVLYEAACEALEQDAACTQYEFTVNLKYADGTWWIIPDSALLTAVSGGLAG